MTLLCCQAIERGLAEGFDIVLCDTSGRLHNNWALMDELAKCKRIVEKRLKGAPHEVRSGVCGVGESLDMLTHWQAWSYYSDRCSGQ